MLGVETTPGFKCERTRVRTSLPTDSTDKKINYLKE
jgi:hypothetical protein